MLSSNNIKNILTSLFNKSKEEHDKEFNHLSDRMNEGWISSGTIEQLRGEVNHDVPFDYYSEEEQLIGQWVDGKPIYRKIIQLTETISLGNSNWTSTGYVMEDMIPISVRAIYYDDNGENNTPPLAFYILNNILQLMSYRNGTQLITPNHYLVIEYTKTTDTSIDKKEIVANGINMQLYDGTHYSEDELLIGQWIDGKPLYRKVYTVTKEIKGNEVKLADISILNIDTIVDTKAIVLKYNGNENFKSVNGNLLIFTKDKNTLLCNSEYSYTVNSVKIIVEYTKTTDTPFSVDEDIAWYALDSDVNDVLNNIGE